LTKNWNDYPHLLADLDRSKNKNHTYKGKPCSVLDLTPGTSKRIDWKCSTCDNEWQAVGCSRSGLRTGCPACANKAIHSDGRNSMATTHPELAIEYQGDATKVIAGTNKKLDWKCSTCDNEWQATGGSRYMGRGCPACIGFLHSDGRNSMDKTYPDLAIEYQGDATKIIATTETKLAWKCSTCEHEWKANGRNRSVLGAGCPPCGMKKATESFKITNLEKKGSMAETHPKLAAEYQGDATKIVAGVNIKLDWKCSTCDNEWQATGGSRYMGKGCPACSNLMIHSDGRNVMAVTHPELASEYLGDATKIVAGTATKLSWKCKTCGHKWMATGDSRSSGKKKSGCPPCGQKQSTQTLLKNNLYRNGSMAETHPELALEYQGNATKIIAGTNNKLSWKCLVVSDEPCGHEWITSGNSRSGTKENGCPACATYGFKPNKPAWAYLLKYQFSDGIVRYKQGITNNEVKRRISQLSGNVNKVFPETKVTLIGQKYFEVGHDARDLETYFLSLTDIRWTPEIKFDGSTEMYAEGILEAWAERL